METKHPLVKTANEAHSYRTDWTPQSCLIENEGNISQENVFREKEVLCMIDDLLGFRSSIDESHLLCQSDLH